MNRWGFLVLFLHISLLPETSSLPVNSMQVTTVFQLWFVFPMTGVCGLQTTPQRSAMHASLCGEISQECLAVVAGSPGTGEPSRTFLWHPCDLPDVLKSK